MSEPETERERYIRQIRETLDRLDSQQSIEVTDGEQPDRPRYIQ